VSPAAPPSSVLTCPQVPDLTKLLERFGLRIVRVADREPIPGSFWGEPEAGLIGHRLLVRDDTPLHSALHEACHYICMDESRRGALHTDAGGNDLEENAVCYLQILLADQLDEAGRDRLFDDMDAWGYSFRLGSARAWFESDADDARQWLLDQGLIDARLRPTWRIRLTEVSAPRPNIVRHQPVG
jgi:hypothetical protein